MENNNKRLVFIGKARDLIAYLARFKIVNGSFELSTFQGIDVC